MQEFTAPLNTNYKIECWGAQGGNSYEDHSFGDYLVPVYGGKGGYSSGEISFPTSLSIYIYVGQSGEGTRELTFNGGGRGGTRYNAFSGGGATDIRLSNGTWSNFNSLKSRIIVAAGGGGAQHWRVGCDGGHAGGLLGQDGLYSTSSNHDPNDSYFVAKGASQTIGGKGGSSGGGQVKFSATDGIFGVGGDHNDMEHGSGGGGGYYGGGGGGHNVEIVGSGAGGSSFISGYTGCDAIDESSTEDNIIHTGQPNHYSGKVFTNSVMIAGNAVMPKPKGGAETGHTGNGYCIISWISPNL